MLSVAVRSSSISIVLSVAVRYSSISIVLSVTVRFSSISIVLSIAVAVIGYNISQVSSRFSVFLNGV